MSEVHQIKRNTSSFQSSGSPDWRFATANRWSDRARKLYTILSIYSNHWDGNIASPYNNRKCVPPRLILSRLCIAVTNIFVTQKEMTIIKVLLAFKRADSLVGKTWLAKFGWQVKNRFQWKIEQVCWFTRRCNYRIVGIIVSNIVHL